MGKQQSKVENLIDNSWELSGKIEIVQKYLNSVEKKIEEDSQEERMFKDIQNCLNVMKKISWLITLPVGQNKKMERFLGYC